MKGYRYEIGDVVQINEFAKVGMPSFVGRVGTIKDFITHGSFDYEIEFDIFSAGRFKECELDVKGSVSVSEDFSNVSKPKTRTDLHREVIEEIHNTFKIKNADYGNSFGEQYDEYGLLSAVIRLDDKMRRLKQLMKQEAQVKDESIRDTILDLANYAIMTVMELDKK